MTAVVRWESSDGSVEGGCCIGCCGGRWKVESSPSTAGGTWWGSSANNEGRTPPIIQPPPPTFHPTSAKLTVANPIDGTRALSNRKACQNSVVLLRRGLCHYGIKVDHAVQAGGGKGGTVRAVLIGNHPPHSQATNGAGASTYERLNGECSNTNGPEAVFPMAGVLKPNHKHRKYLQQTDTQNNETEIFSYPPVVLISHTSLRKILELERNLTNQSTRRGGRSRGIPTTSEVIITVENVTTSHVPLLRNSELGAAVRGACLDGDEALLQCLIHHMADVKGRKNRARGLSSLLEGHLAEDDGSGAAALVSGGEQKGDGEGSGGEDSEGGGTRHAREEAGSGVGEKGLDVRGAEMLRFLDEQDVDRGVSALHVAVEAAVESQSYGCLKTLLAAGVDTELLRTDGYNALHIAVEAGNVDVVTMLLDSGSWVDAPQVPLGWTSLHLAVKNGDLGTVELLLRRGATATVRAMDGSRPLHIGAFFRLSAVVVCC
mmetsp:Transcript_33112/g.87428  ORF Transcript_33112/g.87428 Transcript_33112/m.87428 type:complete len:488 (-) Transcript_33112:1820-3283(-)